MTDSTMTPTPLLTAQGVTVCTKFSDDLAALCNQASKDGMTAVMIGGQMWYFMQMIGFQAKDDTDAAIAAQAASSGNPTLVNGISTTAMTNGSVTLKINTFTTSAVDENILSIALDPSPSAVTQAVYSAELKHSVENGTTYTANTLWTGVTLYGKPGDLLRLTNTNGVVEASVSQDNGVTFTSLCKYEAISEVPLYVHLNTGNATCEVTGTGF